MSDFSTSEDGVQEERFSVGGAGPGRMRLDLGNPLVLFVALWSTGLFLTGLRLTKQLAPVSTTMLLLVGANVLTFAAILAALALHFPAGRAGRPPRVDPATLDRLRRFARSLLAVWALGTLAEILVARGVPIEWLLLGDTSRDYTDFGIPSVHGLLMAIFMFATSAVFLGYLLRRRRGDLCLLLVLVCWPVVLVSRASLIWTLMQLVGVYAVVHRVRLTNALRVLIVGCVLIWAFGVLGDMRMGLKEGTWSSIVSDNAQSTFGKAPSGVVWTYIYLTSSINNVSASIDEVRPLYSPYYSTQAIFPTVLRSGLFTASDQKYPLPLVNEALNTATFYASYLADFGIVGALIAMTALQFFTVLFYLSARRGVLWAILAYAVCFQALVMTPFTDTFTSLVALMQICLALYLRLVIARPRPRSMVARRQRGVHEDEWHIVAS